MILWGPRRDTHTMMAVARTVWHASTLAQASPCHPKEVQCLAAMAEAGMVWEGDHVRLYNLPVPRISAVLWHQGYRAALARLRAQRGWRGRLLMCNEPATEEVVSRMNPAPFSAQQPIGSHGHHDICLRCHEGGRLLMCDGCACATHVPCAGLSSVPPGAWYCPECLTPPDPCELPVAPQQQVSGRDAQQQPSAGHSSPRRTNSFAQQTGRTMDYLHVGTVNATGLSAETLADLSVLFQKQELDVVAVTESWEGAPCKDISVPGYKWYGRARVDTRGTHSSGSGGTMGDASGHGGVGFFVVNGLAHRVSDPLHRPNLADSMWIMISGHSASEQALCMGVVYMLPNNREAQLRKNAFQALQQDIAAASATGEVILLGDFNSRIGRDAQPGAHVGPFLRDEGTNSNGALLRSMLATQDLYVLNGRTRVNGEVTYEHPNGSSCIDFVIAGKRVLQACMDPTSVCDLHVYPAAVQGTLHKLVHVHLPAAAPTRAGRPAPARLVPRLHLLRNMIPVPEAPGSATPPAGADESPTTYRDLYQAALRGHVDGYVAYVQDLTANPAGRTPEQVLQTARVELH